MFGSEHKKRNRVIVVTSQFDLDLIFKGQKGHTKLKRIMRLDIDQENAHM